MYHNTALGLPIEKLNVVVVEDSRSMQEVIRSILASLRVERIRMFSNADEALKAMSVEPPNLIITDWRMKPLTGYNLLKIVRHKSMMPLCFVPVIMISGHATPTIVEKAFRAGAQQFLVKPVSPNAVLQRIEMVLKDERTFTLEGDHYVIGGVAEELDKASARDSLAKQIHLGRLIEFREQKRVEKRSDKPASGEEEGATAASEQVQESDAPPYYTTRRKEAARRIANGKTNGQPQQAAAEAEPSVRQESRRHVRPATEPRKKAAGSGGQARNPRDDFAEL